ncbi:MAG: trehalose-phosphatase [Corynebacterium sp.]|nr:trehalose-phosphatase [Corynebacterium sp.]
MWLITDFDGTLAGFSPDPHDVPIEQDAIDALVTIASKTKVNVAILTGRSLDSVDRLGLPTENFILAGSHGAELRPSKFLPDFSLNSDPTMAAIIGDEVKARRASLLDVLQSVAAKYDGAWIEDKPFHLVFHYRKVADDQEAALLKDVLAVDPHGTHVVPGNKVVEFAFTTITKGDWVAAARKVIPGPVTYLGDDTPDETVFAILGDGDRGIKVGDGDTKAIMRLADIPAVTEFFVNLATYLTTTPGADEATSWT